MEAADLPDGQEPVETDWKVLKETGVKIDTKKTTVNIDSKSGWQGGIPHMTVLCLSAEFLLNQVHILSALQ